MTPFAGYDPSAPAGQPLTGNRYYHDLDAFAAAMDRLPDEIMRAFTIIVVQGAALEGARVAVRESPYLTGRTRANWIASLDEPEDGHVWEQYGDGAQAFARMVEVIKEADVGQVIWVVNNVPYVYYLEHGTSKMRAYAMSEKAAQAAERYVAKVSTRWLQ